MSTDFTDTVLTPEGRSAKAETRQRPLDAVRESSFLWSHETGTLRCDWMELSGVGAPTLGLLLKEGALVPGGSARFIGVDAQPDVIQGCRALYGPTAPAEWQEGRMETLVAGRGAFPNVGVLVYDTQDGVWRDSWTALGRVVAFARRQFKELGEFVLVVNVVGDQRFTTGTDVDRYLSRLSDAVGHEVRADALHVYRSKILPMYWTMVTFGF